MAIKAKIEILNNDGTVHRGWFGEVCGINFSKEEPISATQVPVKILHVAISDYIEIPENKEADNANT